MEYDLILGPWKIENRGKELSPRNMYCLFQSSPHPLPILDFASINASCNYVIFIWPSDLELRKILSEKGGGCERERAFELECTMLYYNKRTTELLTGSTITYIHVIWMRTAAPDLLQLLLPRYLFFVLVLSPFVSLFISCFTSFIILGRAVILNWVCRCELKFIDEIVFVNMINDMGSWIDYSK